MKKFTMFVMVSFFFLAFVAGNTVMGQQRGGCFTSMGRPAPCGGSHFSNPCGGCGGYHTGVCGGGGAILQQLLCGSCHMQHTGPCGGGVGFNTWGGGGAPVLAPTLNLNFGGRNTVSNVPAQAYQNRPTDQYGRVIPSQQASSAQGSEDDDYDGGNERVKSRSTGSPTASSTEKPYLDAEIAQILRPDHGFDSIQIYLGTEVVLEEFEITRRFVHGTLVKSPDQMVFRTDLLGVVDSFSRRSDVPPAKIYVSFDETNKDMKLLLRLDENSGRYVFAPSETRSADGITHSIFVINGKEWIIKSGYGAEVLYQQRFKPNTKIAKGRKQK